MQKDTSVAKKVVFYFFYWEKIQYSRNLFLKSYADRRKCVM